MKKEYCVANFMEMIKKSIKSYRRPSGYYFNNSTNKEYWKGAKQGWRDCIDYIDAGDLDKDFEKIILKVIKYYSPQTIKEWKMACKRGNKNNG